MTDEEGQPKEATAPHRLIHVLRRVVVLEGEEHHQILLLLQALQACLEGGQVELVVQVPAAQHVGLRLRGACEHKCVRKCVRV